jgi:hypothetical protein
MLAIEKRRFGVKYPMRKEPATDLSQKSEAEDL